MAKGDQVYLNRVKDLDKSKINLLPELDGKRQIKEEEPELPEQEPSRDSMPPQMRQFQQKPKAS